MKYVVMVLECLNWYVIAALVYAVIYIISSPSTVRRSGFMIRILLYSAAFPLVYGVGLYCGLRFSPTKRDLLRMGVTLAVAVIAVTSAAHGKEVLLHKLKPPEEVHVYDYWCF